MENLEHLRNTTLTPVHGQYRVRKWKIFYRTLPFGQWFFAHSQDEALGQARCIIAERGGYKMRIQAEWTGDTPDKFYIGD
jgi:hypothetical protein